MNYSVLFLTCDKNEDLWEPFFYLFKKYWPQYSGTVYINTETKSFSYKDVNICVLNHFYGKNDRWAKRLKDCLNSIKDDYVILILDDFFFSDFVDHKEVLKCIKYMDDNNDIACFSYWTSQGKVVRNEFEKYGLKDKKARYRINLQIALWRRKTLIKFIRNHENPWTFETMGTRRCARYKERVYHLNYNTPMVFKYPVGGVLAGGKWRDPQAIELIKKEELSIDVSQRGLYHDGEKKQESIKKESKLKYYFDAFRSLI